jgi:hypothetical protein
MNKIQLEPNSRWVIGHHVAKKTVCVASTETCGDSPTELTLYLNTMIKKGLQLGLVDKTHVLCSLGQIFKCGETEHEQRLRAKVFAVSFKLSIKPGKFTEGDLILLVHDAEAA